VPPPPPPFWDNPAFWVYLLTWLPFVAFLTLYGTRSQWSESGIGRALFTLAASMVAVLTNALAGIVFGDYPGRDMFRLVLLGGVSLAGWNLLRNLVGVQREAGRTHDDPELTHPKETP